ncbi:biopolymer transporter ExbD [Opitutales bacterium]|nr:biopolymer transporter ExbD [Opitutales bacterium]
MRRRLVQEPERTEINVSPLIDLVFILLIFFIVATSFVNEVGITPKHKDTASSSTNLEEPLAFDLPASGQLLQNGMSIGIEQVAPLVRSNPGDNAPSVLVRVSPGARAGLATQVMDQAMLGGAQAVKLSPLAQ